MSCVLYYSNHCKHCKELITILSQSKLKEEVHFICIDTRIKKNGATYIQLQNGQEIMLPPNVRRVPSLLLLNRGHRILTGQDINEYIIEKNVKINNQATNNNGEPLAFSMGEFGIILSDNYSYLDQSAEEMSAKGTGGMRQIHNYATITYSSNIATPPDTYTADTVGNDHMSMDKIIQQRNKDVPPQQPRI